MESIFEKYTLQDVGKIPNTTPQRPNTTRKYQIQQSKGGRSGRRRARRRGRSQFADFPLVEPTDLLSLASSPIGPAPLTFWLKRRGQSYTLLRLEASASDIPCVPGCPCFLSFLSFFSSDAIVRCDSIS